MVIDLRSSEEKANDGDYADPEVKGMEMFESNQTVKSAIKLIKNSKGVNWEIKVVAGEEDLIEGLKVKALQVHNSLLNLVNGETPIAEPTIMTNDNY